MDGSIALSQAAGINSTGFIEVVDVHLDYVTTNITGMVKGGYLDLKGKLGKCKAIFYIGRKRCLDINGVEIMDWNTVGDGEPGAQMNWDEDPPEYARTKTSHSYYYMPGQRRADEKGNIFADFLLLEVVDHNDGVFKRIGFCHATSLLSSPREEERVMVARQHDEAGPWFSMSTVRERLAYYSHYLAGTDVHGVL